MTTRITVDQLERMKVHDVADLLANVVLLLKRIPNVECRELLQTLPDEIHLQQEYRPEQLSSTRVWNEQDLKDKKVADLKKIADELHIPYTSRIKKDELAAKILARSARADSGRSEQYAIQEL